MKVYIAAPLFNTKQREVISMLEHSCVGLGHEIFSPYRNSKEIFQGRAPKDCLPYERRQVIEDNVSNLSWCDILLAWVGGMGGFTDPGVVWEMGYAKAKGKTTIAYIDPDLDTDRQGMNLMLSATIDMVVQGGEQLNRALAAFPVDRTLQVRQLFDPATVLGTEMDPVV